MVYTYTKINSDFINGLNIKKFDKDIRKNTNINSNFKGIKYNSESIHIYFESQLDTSGESELNSMVNSHDGKDPSYPTYNIIHPYITNHKVKISKYSTCASFIYNGGLFSKITLIQLLTEQNKNSTFDIKIYDATNNNILNEKTDISNTDKTIINMEGIANIPTTDAIIEIFAKVKKGDLFLHDIKVFYE